MKEYTVTIRRETQIKITIDENIVDKEALDAIQYNFDEDLFELDSCVDQCACEDTYTQEEIGYMNYAKHSAMHKIGLTNEFITLEREHTKALIEQDDFEFDINEEGTV